MHQFIAIYYDILQILMNAILIMEDVSSFVTIQLVAITVHATTATHSILTIICVMVS